MINVVRAQGSENKGLLKSIFWTSTDSRLQGSSLGEILDLKLSAWLPYACLCRGICTEKLPSVYIYNWKIFIYYNTKSSWRSVYLNLIKPFWSTTDGGFRSGKPKSNQQKEPSHEGQAVSSDASYASVWLLRVRMISTTCIYRQRLG